MEINERVVREIGELAQLKVTRDDLPELLAGMQNILDLADAMTEVDTSMIQPLSNPLDATQQLRADEVTEHDNREQFQAIAPETADGLYLVPKVVE